jgi:hypothetical protein
MARYLFIVARDQPELCAHLAREFSGEIGVAVVLDRRRAERRRRGAPGITAERRRAERRSRPPIHSELQALNFALVTAD